MIEKGGKFDFKFISDYSCGLAKLLEKPGFKKKLTVAAT